jgi:hypothetical protein
VKTDFDNLYFLVLIIFCNILLKTLTYCAQYPKIFDFDRTVLPVYQFFSLSLSLSLFNFKYSILLFKKKKTASSNMAMNLDVKATHSKGQITIYEEIMTGKTTVCDEAPKLGVKY